MEKISIMMKGVMKIMKLDYIPNGYIVSDPQFNIEKRDLPKGEPGPERREREVCVVCGGGVGEGEGEGNWTD